MDVGGQPLAVLALLRLSRCGAEAVLATSVDATDNPLAQVATRAGFRVVRGSLDDVRSRFVQASADLSPLDVLVRATADNPVPDGDLVSDLIALFDDGGGHYVGFDQQVVPEGLGLEAFSVGDLRAAAEHSHDLADQEHVTPWVRRLPGARMLGLPSIPSDQIDLRCTVDTEEDYVNAASAFAFIREPVRETWQGVLNAFAGRSDHPTVAIRDRTRLSQSSLVLGTAQFGSSYGVMNHRGEPTDAEVSAVLDVASQVGVTHVDTARAYGRSEKRLGAICRSGIAVPGAITKVAPANPQQDREQLNAHVRSSVAASLQALGDVAPEAVLFHRADDALRHHATGWATLRDLGAAHGFVAGVSVQTPAELTRVLALPEFCYVQLPFNLLDRRWLRKELVSELEDRDDVVVAVRSVFLQGLLLSAPDTPWPNTSPRERSEYHLGLTHAMEATSTPTLRELAIGFAIGQPWVTSIVVGADSAYQLAETARAVASVHLTQDQLDVVTDLVPGGPANLVDPSRWT